MSRDPRVMAYFPRTLSRTESEAMAGHCEMRLRERGWGVWAVERRDTAAFIGIIGLNRPRIDLPPSPCVEILWRLARPYWGRGYATEGAAAALDVGFRQLGLPEILSFAVAANQRSRAVMARLGMTNTGEIFDHPDIAEASALRPHCLYRISRWQWLRRQA